MEKNKAKRIFKDSLAYIREPGLLEFFMGMHPRLKVEGASAFFFIFLLYQYHLRYDTGDSVLNSLTIMEELINLVRKNKLPFFRLKRNKLLERQYRKSDLKTKADYELFFPIYQNFILNVFWYNALCMLIDLGKRKNITFRRYEKWCKKIKHNFSRQYIKSFVNNPLDADQKYAFAFHPSLIFSITLPFSILTNREAQILYRILIKQFLVDEGISYPLRDSVKDQKINSSILIGEYLAGYNMLMRDKDFLLEHFQRIAARIILELNNGIIGFIPNATVKNSETISPPRRASGVATAETAYFFKLLEKIQTESDDTSKS